MFTGIIEEIGTILSIGNGVLKIQAKKVISDISLGDSIAVNGVCLTATDFSKDWFCADVMPETLRMSNLGFLKNGSKVNLERAMMAGGRFGGHMVSGHIDGTGEIISMAQEGNAIWICIKPSKELLRYIVTKGSIAIDGISLTVAKTDDLNFKVSIIPHTGQETILLTKKRGSTVNLETDIIAKYTEKLLGLGTEKKESKIDMDFLTRCGY